VRYSRKNTVNYVVNLKCTESSQAPRSIYELIGNTQVSGSN
jgi:hypothetical protein